MKLKRWAKRTGIGIVVAVGGLGGAYWYAISPHHSFAPPESAEGLLNRADTLSWMNRWAEARPLYAKAAGLFTAAHQPAKALYATVSEIPADESASAPANILRLTRL